MMKISMMHRFSTGDQFQIRKSFSINMNSFVIQRFDFNIHLILVINDL